MGFGVPGGGARPRRAEQRRTGSGHRLECQRHDLRRDQERHHEQERKHALAADSVTASVMAKAAPTQGCRCWTRPRSRSCSRPLSVPSTCLSRSAPAGLKWPPGANAASRSRAKGKLANTTTQNRKKGDEDAPLLCESSRMLPPLARTRSLAEDVDKAFGVLLGLRQRLGRLQRQHLDVAASGISRRQRHFAGCAGT